MCVCVWHEVYKTLELRVNNFPRADRQSNRKRGRLRLGTLATNCNVLIRVRDGYCIIMAIKWNKPCSSRRWLFTLRSRSQPIVVCIPMLFKYGCPRHSGRTRKMNRLQATTVLLVASVTAVAADVATTAGLGQASPPPSDWFRGCGAADWPQCVAQNVARTFRLLEQSDRLQIADGVRLVKTTTTTDRSAK